MELNIDLSTAGLDEYKQLFKKSPHELGIVKTKKSLINNEEYEHINIADIEDVMDSLFLHWFVEIINPPLINYEKSGNIAVTITVKICYLIGTEYFHQFGIATETVNSQKLLTLAVPKCVTSATKNAAKKIGNILGKNLNRSADEIELPTQQIQTETPDRAEQRMKILIDDCNTIDELKSYQLIIPSNLKEYYNEKLKTL